MPTIEELQAELAKRDEQIRGISSKLQAHERVVRELGDAVERDAYGNPVRVRVEPEPAPRPAGGFMTGHPLAPLSSYAGDGWTPEAVDAYYEQRVASKGYLTKPEAEALADLRAKEYANRVLGNAMVWRMHDKLTNQPVYRDLADGKSAMSTRTARILQERGYGKPISEQARGFDEWQYDGLDKLQFAADVARMELADEAKAAAASAESAKAVAAAGGLSPAPTTTGGAPVAPGKPDFTTMKTPEEIVAALDVAMVPAGTP